MLMVVKPRMPVTTELLPRGRERKEDEEEGAIDGGGLPAASLSWRPPCVFLLPRALWVGVGGRGGSR
jgi:hypothetical protein